MRTHCLHHTWCWIPSEKSAGITSLAIAECGLSRVRIQLRPTLFSNHGFYYAGISMQDLLQITHRGWVPAVPWKEEFKLSGHNKQDPRY